MKGQKALKTILVNSSTNFNLNQDTYQETRKDLNKLYRQNVSLSFNQTCLNERLLPNYTHIIKILIMLVNTYTSITQ